MTKQKKTNTAPNPERLRELLAAGTELPWRWSDNGNIVPASYPHGKWDFEIAAVYTERDDDEAPANAELIIETINALPALLHQLAEERSYAADTAVRVLKAERALRAAERGREEACRMLREIHDSMQLNEKANATIAAFLAASGGENYAMVAIRAGERAALRAAMNGGTPASPATGEDFEAWFAKQDSRTEWRELVRLAYYATSQPAAAQGGDDYLTHHDDFRVACLIAQAHAKSDADRRYWQHQVDVLDRLAAAGES